MCKICEDTEATNQGYRKTDIKSDQFRSPQANTEKWHWISEINEAIDNLGALPIVPNYLLYQYINYIRK